MKRPEYTKRRAKAEEKRIEAEREGKQRTEKAQQIDKIRSSIEDVTTNSIAASKTMANEVVSVVNSVRNEIKTSADAQETSVDPETLSEPKRVHG